MTNTKKIKILKEALEKNGDQVVLYLVDYYKRKLAEAKDIVNDTKNKSYDWRDFIYNELKISSLIEAIESGSNEYDSLVRQIQFGKYKFNTDYKLDKVEASSDEFEKFYQENKETLDKYNEERMEIIKKYLANFNK